ncbi:hypothetical protein V1460_26255 [Streptomyces sp. SCSIO 30461]|uniref:VOC family protein n=1 Tax=Streptomyces sp. SCSIO 30461 TaxID=3118085 RepID=UPI0030D5C6A8
MLRGLTTVSFQAADPIAAKAWYTELLGKGPYFERPGYAEFRLSMGGKVYERLTERGPGFVTASVVDPFGNVLGIMYNAHYLEMPELNRRACVPARSPMSSSAS